MLGTCLKSSSSEGFLGKVGVSHSDSKIAVSSGPANVSRDPYFTCLHPLVEPGLQDTFHQQTFAIVSRPVTAAKNFIIPDCRNHFCLW